MGFELLEALKKEQKADAVERAWDTVKEWIASNQEHFEVKHLNEVAREPLLGRYEPGHEKAQQDGRKENLYPAELSQKNADRQWLFLRKEHPWFQGPWICRKQTGKPASWKEQRKGDHR